MCVPIADGTRLNSRVSESDTKGRPTARGRATVPRWRLSRAWWTDVATDTRKTWRKRCGGEWLHLWFQCVMQEWWCPRSRQRLHPSSAIFNQPDDVLTHCIGICKIYSIKPINGRVMYLPSSFSNRPWLFQQLLIVLHPWRLGSKRMPSADRRR